MNPHLAFDFTVHKETNTILVTREFNAELPTVWSAFTKAEILDQWWAPQPWKARTKQMDFTEGGYWHYAMVGPEGEEHWAFANFIKIDLHKSYSLKDGFSDADGNVNNELPQSNWDVKFTNNGLNTLVQITITHNSLQDLESNIQMGFKEGFTIAMDGLDSLIPSLKK
jgi:uncharacterized protein YndB with AHSA1/START domain